jgi:hypothetical protein
MHVVDPTPIKILDLKEKLDATTIDSQYTMVLNSPHITLLSFVEPT